MKKSKKNNGFATIALVLSIIGICLSFIPVINNAAFFLGALAIIFGIIALVKKSNKTKPIIAIIIGILAVGVTLSLQSDWSKSLDKVSDDIDKATGNKTEDVLKDVDVKIGNLEIKVSEYGLVDSKLPVKVTNKLTEKKSYNITIEAISADGSRIAEDYIYANDLAANQSQEFNLFEYISSDNVDAMKNATFRIIEASSY